MKYQELRELTSSFWHQSIERARIERFARNKMALITILGSLTAFYGIAVNYLYSPEQAEKIDIFLITPVWQYSSAFLAKFGFSAPLTIAAIGICSSLMAILFTMLFSILHPVKESHSLVLSEEDNFSNMKKLKEQFFDDAKRRIIEASENTSNICWYLLFSLIISISMGVQSERIFAGICYGFLSYIVLFIFRGLFIVSVKHIWKKDCWEMQFARLEAEFNSIVSKLDTEDTVESPIDNIEQEDKKTTEKLTEEQKTSEVPKTVGQKEDVKQKQDKMQNDILDEEKLYKEAIASEPIGEDVDKKTDITKELLSVVYSDPDMAYTVAKGFCQKACSSEYTEEEKMSFWHEAYDVLSVVENNNNHTANTKFLYSFVVYELAEGLIKTKSECEKIMEYLLFAKNSEALDESNKSTCSMILDAVIETLNDFNSPNSTSKCVKVDCIYRNAGICTKKSDSFYVAHCDYIDSPAVCPDFKRK